ncbi:uncharacterized protein LOC144199430 isoform X2 [Stigmatopora nigra]
MSVQYTIDIQLTELGFSDILQAQESLSCDESPSPCRSPVSTTPDPPRGSQFIKEQPTCPHKDPQPPASLASQAGVLPVLEPSPCQQLQASPSGQEIGSMACSPNDDKDQKRLDNESKNSEEHVCSVCRLRLPSSFKLQDHMNLHTGARPYSCAECGKRFSQIQNYHAHLRMHGQNGKERPQCRICLLSFPSHDTLERHLLGNHLENEFYECDLCKRVFTTLKACEHHVEMHRIMPEVVCVKCGRHFTQAKFLQRHQREGCQRVFNCPDCVETFANKDLLLKHSFFHLRVPPYTCVKCRCHFRLPKLYRQHKCEPWRIHCVACLRVFSSRNSFLKHKKETGCWGNCDVKEDEIRCLECGISFGTTEELKEHGGAHQRVLKCAECGKGFRSALLLMSHMGGHAGKSPCLCQSCGLGFPHQQNYESHMKTCVKTAQPAKAPMTVKKHPPSKKRNIMPVPTATDTSIPTAALPVPTIAPKNATSTATNSSVLQIGRQDPPTSNGTLAFPLSQPVLGIQTPAAQQCQNQDPQCEPMDLSEKESDPAQNGVALPQVKGHTGELEASGEAMKHEVNTDCLLDLSITSSTKTSEPQSTE